MKRNIWFMSILLTIIGLVMVYSASHVLALSKYGDSYYFVKRQVLFAIIGLIGMKITSKMDYHLYKRYASILIMICFILLILVLIPGIGMIRGGSRSWFSLGAFALQPSELFKVGMIIYCSKYIDDHYHQLKKLRYAFVILAIALIGFVLIMMQPDFGTGLVMIATIVVMLVCTPLSLCYFIYLALAGVVGLVGLILSAPYRMQRILAFLDPFADPLGSGFQMIQSLYAIGPGGLLGVGFDKSIQKHFYLPEPQTDFIFAIACEELGFIGASLLVICYFILIVEGLRVSIQSIDIYGSFLALGITAMIAIQVFINLGVVVGLFPVTGITLPFMSYGGTSLTIIMTCIGILLNIQQKS